MPAIANDARFWDRIARKYAADPIADMIGYERTLARTRDHLKPADYVLEIGCGTGATALKLAASVSHYVASDIAPEMIAIAKEKVATEGKTNMTCEVATPENAHWPDASFDAVLAFNLLHLVKARGAALQNVQRVLKPGGLFISKTPCLKEMNPFILLAVPLMQAIGKALFVTGFTAEQLEREIAAAGFAIVERDRHGSRGKDARIFLIARKAV